MSLSEKATLLALERLMEEFFYPATSNSKKHDIETQLSSFRSQKDSWQMCLYFITHTTSHYVSMYALTTIESVINRQWYSLDWESRTQLRTRLYTLYIEQNDAAPHFIRNKLAKLLVDVAKYDWPHFYPEFFTNLLGLLKSDGGQLLGLVLLKTTSEELTSERPDLNSTRKDELKRLLQQNIPEVFQILISILHNLGTKPRHKTTATPPPSPTQQTNLTPNLAQAISSVAFRPDSKAVIRETLAVTQHLLSWVSLCTLPIQIIGAIFNFTHISSYAQDDDDICLLALSTLNELLYRKCAPPGSESLFVQLYHNTIQLLRDVTCNMTGRIETLSFDFMEKLSELLCLLMEQHLWRLEAEPEFSALELLTLLFQLTMQLPHLQCYVRCLAIWVAFIKQIKPQNAHRYSEALQGLITAVLNKMQFTYNFQQLNEFDVEEYDDENESELKICIQTSIEIIAMVGEFAPSLTFNEVLIPWKNYNDVYCMLQNAVNHVSCTLSLQNTEYQRLHCVLRDLNTLTQALARLSTLFNDQGDCNTSASVVLDNVVSKIMESASMTKTVKFYHLKLNNPKLVNDFVEVQSEFLASLKTWCSLNANKSTKYNKQMVELALHHVKCFNQEPRKVCRAAAHLLLTLSTNVFPPALISVPDVVQFLAQAPSLKHFNRETSELVNTALCNVLVRPWGVDLSQADAQRRLALVESYFAALTKDFVELTPHTDELKVNEIVGGTLPVLSNVVEYCNNYPSHSKKLLYLGLKWSIEHALVLFPSYSKYNEASNHILIYFLNVLGVLQQQMGVEATKHAVEVFLEVAVGEQQSRNLSGLDKLLQILQLVVEAPGNCFRSFLPGIIQLCLNNVYPAVMPHANECPDVAIALLNLLHGVLSHRWNYFFVSQVRMGHSPGCSDVNQAPDKTQQPDQLLSILEVFGRALLQRDINVFRVSLTSLENLNSKWKLYHKDLFRERLLGQFLTVLLRTLLDNTHNLLHDDINAAVYNLALVDFDGFFTIFLDNFLRAADDLSQSQKKTLKDNFKCYTDVPTFIQNLRRFVNDLCCYRLCNSSLPPGSVVL